MLGTTLFLRLHRKVVLTPAGEGYARAIRGAFDAIGRATQLLAHKSAPRRLALNCEPGFANRCPACSEPESEPAAKSGGVAADDRKSKSEVNEARRDAMRNLLYRKDS